MLTDSQILCKLLLGHRLPPLDVDGWHISISLHVFGLLWHQMDIFVIVLIHRLWVSIIFINAKRFLLLERVYGLPFLLRCDFDELIVIARDLDALELWCLLQTLG